MARLIWALIVCTTLILEKRACIDNMISTEILVQMKVAESHNFIL